jgi:hypothetical protein
MPINVRIPINKKNNHNFEVADKMPKKSLLTWTLFLVVNIKLKIQKIRLKTIQFKKNPKTNKLEIIMSLLTKKTVPAKGIVEIKTINIAFNKEGSSKACLKVSVGLEKILSVILLKHLFNIKTLPFAVFFYFSNHFLFFLRTFFYGLRSFVPFFYY